MWNYYAPSACSDIMVDSVLGSVSTHMIRIIDTSPTRHPWCTYYNQRIYTYVYVDDHDSVSYVTNASWIIGCGRCPYCKH